MRQLLTGRQMPALKDWLPRVAPTKAPTSWLPSVTCAAVVGSGVLGSMNSPHLMVARVVLMVWLTSAGSPPV